MSAEQENLENHIHAPARNAHINREFADKTSSIRAAGQPGAHLQLYCAIPRKQDLHSRRNEGEQTAGHFANDLATSVHAIVIQELYV